MSADHVSRPSLEFDRRFDAILATEPVLPDAGERLGESRGGRPIHGFRSGRGPTRVSLIAGCHADEPVGPRFLSHLAAYLATCHDDDPLRSDFDWWLVPHMNPDGAQMNRRWYQHEDDRFRVGSYLLHVQRELPGDDIEFGFPRGPDDSAARPENRAAYQWWFAIALRWRFTQRSMGWRSRRAPGF